MIYPEGVGSGQRSMEGGFMRSQKLATGPAETSRAIGTATHVSLSSRSGGVDAWAFFALSWAGSANKMRCHQRWSESDGDVAQLRRVEAAVDKHVARVPREVATGGQT